MYMNKKPKAVPNDKWPPEIIQHGYTGVPNCLIYCRAALDLSTSEFSVLVHLLSYDYNRKMKAWPAHNTLAEGSNKGGSTIRRNIVSLEKKGFLKRIPKTGRPNVYDLMPLVEKLRKHLRLDHAQKRAHSYSEMSRSPPPKKSTKEYKERIRINKTESIKNIMDRRYKPTHQQSKGL